MLHELKCWPENWIRIHRGNKTAEWRKNDRPVLFAPADFLWLREWEPKKKAYTGRELIAQIVEVDQSVEHGMPTGYAMLSIRLFEGTF